MGACERQRTSTREAVPSLKRRFMFDLGFSSSGNLNESVYGSDNFFLSAKVPIWFSSSRFHLISLVSLRIRSLAIESGNTFIYLCCHLREKPQKRPTHNVY